MGTYQWLLVGLGVAATLVGCVTLEPRPEARAVRLVQDRSLVAGCRWVAEVKGGQYAPFIGAVAHTLDNARTRLKEATAEVGGSVVLVTQHDANPWGTWMYGEAYRCP